MIRTIVGLEVLLICKDAVGVFYSLDWLGYNCMNNMWMITLIRTNKNLWGKKQLNNDSIRLKLKLTIFNKRYTSNRLKYRGRRVIITTSLLSEMSDKRIAQSNVIWRVEVWKRREVNFWGKSERRKNKKKTLTQNLRNGQLTSGESGQSNSCRSANHGWMIMVIKND